MNEIYIDIIRVIHLISVALGMGTAMYLDLKSLSRYHVSCTLSQIQDLKYIHKVVSIALVNLWLTGLMLIYIRTSGDLNNFSPKLYTKVLIVVLLTINSTLIHKYVILVLEKTKGKAISKLNLKEKIPILFIASTSAFCWFSALSLGASSVLKTLDWDILAPLFSIIFIIFIILTLAITALHSEANVLVKIAFFIKRIRNILKI